MKSFAIFIVFLLAVLICGTSAFAQLSGTKTIGGTTPDYATVKAALQDLNAQGVTAPGVMFLIRSGTYVEDSLIIRTSTTSASAPVVIKPDVGATVVIEVTPASTLIPFAIKIDSTAYVTIDGSNSGTSSRDLTIKGMGTNAQKGIWISGQSHYTTIKNTIVRAGATTSSTYRAIDLLYTTAPGGNPNNCAIENNVCRNAYTGVRAEGNTTTDLINNLTIRNNLIDSVANAGTYIWYTWYPVVHDNDISVLVGSSATMYGMYFGSQVRQARAYNNRVHDMNQLSTTATLYGIASFGTSTLAQNSIFNNFVWNLNMPATGTGLLYGIYISGSNSTIPDTVAFNTVNLTGTSSGNRNTRAFGKGSATGGVILYNNILQNTRTDGTTGIAAAIWKTSTTVSLVSNNNNLYVGTPDAQHVTGVISTTTYPTLDDWRTANGSDAQSFAENSPFVSATDLHIQTTVPTQLESGGVPVDGITMDIDGDVRNATTPDVGADEGNFTGLDLTPPVLTHTPLGGTPDTSGRLAVATITDPSGIDTAAGAPRLWYKTSTDTTYTAVVAGSVVGDDYNFTIPGHPAGTTVEYYLAAQDAASGNNVATLPAGGSGINPPGSTPPGTVFSYFIQTPIAGGTYTVGTGGNYATLQDAFDALSLNGISGAVQFHLVDSVYLAPGRAIIPKNLMVPPQATAEEGATAYPAIYGELSNLTFMSPDTVGEMTLAGPIVGSSATNTITIRPAPGVHARIVGNGASLIRLLHASYVIIDGIDPVTNGLRGLQSLTLESLAGAGVFFRGDADNNILRNVTIKAPVSSAIFMDTLAGAADNNIIENNAIPQSFNGVFARGGSYLLFGNRFTGNAFGSATDSIGQVAIYNQQVGGSIIDNNVIQNVHTQLTTVNVAGVWIATKHLGTQIYNNVIHNVRVNTTTSATFAAGLYIFGLSGDNTSGNYYNNMIYDLENLSSSVSSVIRALYGSTGMNDTIVYNSVYVSGVDNAARVTAALQTSTHTDQFIRNNILVNTRVATGTGRAMAFHKLSTTSTITSDYNDLYVPSQTGSYIGGVGTTNYATLADWQTLGYDSNSVSVMPNFVAPHLHINTVIPTPVNGGATPLAGITVDFDGDPRDPSTPDIGADEFSVTPVPPPVVVNVTRSTRVPAAGDTVGVTATITDTLGISSANLLYSINGTPQTPVPMTMTSGTPDSGTWAGTIPSSASVDGNRVEIQIQANSISGAITTTPISPANSYFAGISPLSLSGVRAVDPDGILLYDGYYARVTGTVNGPNFQTTNLGYHFQDAVGGIQLFEFGILIPPLNLGDSIIVTGWLDQFNGLTEIRPDDQTTDVQVVDTGRTVTPIDVLLPVFYANPELYESRLVRLNALQRVRSTPPWPTVGQSVNITMYQVNLSDSIVMRIDSDTELDGTPEPTYPSMVTGVISQFDNTVPRTSGFQTQPRYVTDFAPPGPLTVLFSSSPQAPITDLNYTIDTITVPISLTIGRLQVLIDSITHTWDSDLDVFLFSPSGDSIELFTDVGGSGDNFIGTLLTDTAAISITAGTAPFTGAYRPEASVPPATSFAYFNGSNAMGDWVLQIYDDAGGDIGVLHRWSIIFDESQEHDIGVASLEDAAPGSIEASAQAELSREQSKNPEKYAGIRVMTEPGVFKMGDDAVFTLKAIVQNYGSFAEGSYQVGWQIDGTAQTTVNNTDTLGVGDTDTLVLSWSTPTPGSHTARAWTILAGDANPGNDTSGVLNFTILPTNTIFAEGFNTTPMPPYPDGWHVKNLDGGGTTEPWFHGSPAVIPPFEGSGYIAANYQGANGFYIDQWLVTPNFGVANTTSLNYVDSLTFWQRSPDGSVWPDSIQIRVSTTDTAAASFTTVLDYFEADTIGWRRKAYALPTGARYVAFRYLHYDGGPSGGSSNYVGLDDIRVTRYNTEFSDGFEAYNAGQQLVVQNSTDWRTWSGPSGTGEDPFVSNAQAFNGENSVVIVANNDLVHLISDDTTQTYRLSFRAYIPSGKAGYYNTLNTWPATASRHWAMEAYFDSGTGVNGRLNAGAGTNLPFSYPHNVWMLVELRVDLGGDSAQFLINQALVHSWKWTRSASGTRPKRLAANDFYGATAWDQMYVDNYYVALDSPIVITGVDDGPAVPTVFVLEQNYPNPFNPTTTIKYSLPKESFVTMKVYNVLGQEVARLVNEDQKAGFVTVVWNGRNAVGNMVASGVYFYRIEAKPTDGTNAFVQVKKMMMLK